MHFKHKSCKRICDLKWKNPTKMKPNMQEKKPKRENDNGY